VAIGRTKLATASNAFKLNAFAQFTPADQRVLDVEEFSGKIFQQFVAAHFQEAMGQYKALTYL
jgi:hypothetical protein